MDKSSLGDVEAVVTGGRAVMTAEDGVVLDVVKSVVKSGRTATFYLTPDQFSAVNAWYWTPQRMKHLGLEPVSDEEIARISSALRLDASAFPAGSAYSNRVTCPNGHAYGAVEFAEQGIAEHGLEAAQKVFTLRDAAVIRANPHQQAVCPKCRRLLAEAHYYVYWRYGCCVDLDDTSTAAFTR
ncbi:hypothetical protein [Streptomyces griseosporeus]|uniref:hypothetical protein n=1 Tax=Streptomyces griseosporeus TaxID=1910 RepID=UPI0036B0E4A5